MAKMNITKADARKFAGKIERFKASAKRARAKSEKMTEQVVYMAEVSTAAFAIGVTQGKFGGITAMGVPLELGLGVALNLAGWAGLGGRNAKHLNAIGTGCLAAYATTLGRGVGTQMEGSRDASISGRRLIGSQRSRLAQGPGMSDAALAQYAMSMAH